MQDRKYQAGESMPNVETDSVSERDQLPDGIDVEAAEGAATQRERTPDESATDGESGSADEGAAEPTSLPLDQVFSILKNPRRRYVLKYLDRADGQVTLSEVAEQIAAWENDKEVKQISSSERKRVYVGLYQCHLPKMDTMDIISFNQPRGTIEIDDNVDPLYRYLDISEESDDPAWHVHSLSLAAAGVVVLGGSVLLQSMTAAAVVEGAVLFLLAAFLAYSLAGLYWLRTTDDDTRS